MKVLFVAHRAPWPPTKGDKIRSHRWLLALSEEHEVHLGALCEDPADLRPPPDVAGRLASVGVFPRPSALRGAAGLLRGRSASEGVFQSRELAEWVRATVSHEQPEVAVGFSSTAAQYLWDLDLPKVLDLVDADSRKFRAYGARGLLKALWRLEARRLGDLESRIAKAFDRVTAVSSEEVDALSRVGRAAECLRNGVDLEHFSPSPRGREEPGLVVMTGAMDYRPNVEGASWFASDLLPGIRERFPGARFRIVGSSPTRAVRALGKLAGVEVTGTVADVRPHLGAAEVVVAPLRMAFGVQNKVLEAMASGRAVVATSGAAAGIDAVSGEHLEIADEGSFGEAVAALLADAPRRGEIGRAGRLRMEERYGWEPVMARMREIVREVVS